MRYLTNKSDINFRKKNNSTNLETRFSESNLVQFDMNEKQF